ncbi:hypothetical protein B0T11DRAFT_78760 [Plectosphaerella cucumerina]|uniref:Uncharacterized protein n=1 Tax=Plectosphaerella cucumerina TaxID=40658 RepID=A0A8K0TE72_9PEZI|nr:hypothetical protein B0T11DRAFT_78760 [Plectosphaerella cucumerina]
MPFCGASKRAGDWRRGGQSSSASELWQSFSKLHLFSLDTTEVRWQRAMHRQSSGKTSRCRRQCPARRDDHDIGRQTGPLPSHLSRRKCKVKAPSPQSRQRAKGASAMRGRLGGQGPEPWTSVVSVPSLGRAVDETKHQDPLPRPPPLSKARFALLCSPCPGLPSFMQSPRGRMNRFGRRMKSRAGSGRIECHPLVPTPSSLRPPGLIDDNDMTATRQTAMFP